MLFANEGVVNLKGLRAVVPDDPYSHKGGFILSQELDLLFTRIDVWPSGQSPAQPLLGLSADTTAIPHVEATSDEGNEGGSRSERGGGRCLREHDIHRIAGGCRITRGRPLRDDGARPPQCEAPVYPPNHEIGRENPIARSTAIEPEQLWNNKTLRDDDPDRRLERHERIRVRLLVYDDTGGAMTAPTGNGPLSQSSGSEYCHGLAQRAPHEMRYRHTLRDDHVYR